jgi:signal peptidase
VRVVRRFGDTLLWVLAVFGMLAGILWGATAAGWVQPLVVVSGSMSPTISTGDLLFAVPLEPARLRVGDVATLPNPQSGRYVTHRVVEISRDGSDYLVRMQGDANGAADPEPYRVQASARVWHPVVTVPGAGAVFERVLRPVVVVPLLIGLLALVGLTLLPGGERGRHRAAARMDEGGAAT